MLSQSCEILKGVQKSLLQKLNKCGIFTLADLLFHLPFRYQDKTRITSIQDLRLNDYAVIFGHVIKVEIKQGKRPTLCCYVEDKTAVLCLRFFYFNRQQLSQLKAGSLVRAFGEIKEFAHQRQIIHPEYKIFEHDSDCNIEENLTGIYSTTEGLTQSRIQKLIQDCLKQYASHLKDIEWLNEAQLANLNLPSLKEALSLLHTPPPDTALSLLESKEHPAFKRLILEELVAQQLSMQFARAKRRNLIAPAFEIIPELVEKFKQDLPFSLTMAQAKTIDEIASDLTETKPMLRLVQGDVGCGKTTVAAVAALQSIANGYQVAMMVPTDLLSEQHFNNLQAKFEALGFHCCRLTGKMKVKERRETLEKVANKDCHFLIGTHALFQDSVLFARLGLIIIDEQHRFGVAQRLLLQQKNQDERLSPHQLLMTATPIPRTLAMSKYAHLDISIINELPPGRIPVNTVVINQEQRDLIISRLEANLVEGRQAYWVCTLIEESEKLQCMAATETAQNLQTQLPGIKVGLIHGRMKPIEKEETMKRFKAGEIHLLVATTVIEVGVDVPNASLMIIENAERLGLSQLHQLRGRVGRGNQQAHCLLLYQKPLSKMSAERLKVMRATTDGFLIAEKDLALRGAGEILGSRQTGYKQFKIADHERDKDFLPLARDLAKSLTHNASEIAKQLARRWLGDFESFLQG